MWRNKLGRMPQLGDFLRHEMGAATGFHHDGAGFQFRQILGECCARKLSAVNLVAAIILSMKMKGMFSEVDGGNSYVVHGNDLR
ncbi:hypothetical protein D3C76_1439910 [compost metagenome]